MGKSRIHAAITYLLLQHTSEKVYVIFHNKGLEKKDEAVNKALKTYTDSSGLNWDDRVTYQTGISFEKKPKKGVIIIDESDAVMFENFKEFHDYTKARDLKVICLTATAFDGLEEGVEREALQTLDFKVYQTCKDW